MVERHTQCRSSSVMTSFSVSVTTGPHKGKASHPAFEWTRPHLQTFQTFEVRRAMVPFQ